MIIPGGLWYSLGKHKKGGESMPFIHIQTGKAVSEREEAALKSGLGKAIELLPGKTEAWLMCRIEDRCRLYFRGEKEPPCAMVTVKLFGKKTPADYQALTAAVTGLLNRELQLDPDRVYVQYEECSHWGWNGNNF